MSDGKAISSQAKGEENANKLKMWIRATPLTKVPVNHSGLSAKKTICEALSIPRSTIDSNHEIRSLFVQLDSRLISKDLSECKDHLPVPSDGGGYASADRLKHLTEENEALRLKLNRLQYLEVTARLVFDGTAR